MTGNNVTQTNIPMLTKDRIQYLEEQDKADLLAQHFADVTSDSKLTKTFRKRKQRLGGKWNNIQPKEHEETSYLNEPLSIYELKRAIKQSKNNTAPGQDGISYEVIKI